MAPDLQRRIQEQRHCIRPYTNDALFAHNQDLTVNAPLEFHGAQER